MGSGRIYGGLGTWPEQWPGKMVMRKQNSAGEMLLRSPVSGSQVGGKFFDGNISNGG